MSEPSSFDEWKAKLELTLRGGPHPDVGVMLRLPRASGRILYARGRELLTLTRRSGALFIVNGRLDVALALGADGIYLPERGLPPRDARQRFPSLLVGTSRHDRQGLEEAAAASADYAFLSPIGSVPGKGPPLGVDGFEKAITDLSLPVLALGGVGIDNASALARAGAFGVALLRGLCRAEDPAGLLRGLREALDTAAAVRR